MYKDLIDTIGYLESVDPEVGNAMQKERPVLETLDNCTPWPPSAATDEMTPSCTLFTESCTLTMPTGEFCACTFITAEKTATVARVIIFFIYYGISPKYSTHQVP